jgi:hypothetical protein
LAADPTFAELVASFGERLFGAEWASPMARLTGTNERTVRRVRQAAREGRDYPAARGILAAMLEHLSPIVAELARHAESADRKAR